MNILIGSAAGANRTPLRTNRTGRGWLRDDIYPSLTFPPQFITRDGMEWRKLAISGAFRSPRLQLKSKQTLNFEKLFAIRFFPLVSRDNGLELSQLLLSRSLSPTPSPIKRNYHPRAAA